MRLSIELINKKKNQNKTEIISKIYTMEMTFEILKREKN